MLINCKMALLSIDSLIDKLQIQTNTAKEGVDLAKALLFQQERICLRQWNSISIDLSKAIERLDALKNESETY